MEQKRAKEFDAFLWQLKLLILGAVALCFVPLLIYVLYVDRKMAAFEDTLQHSPPDQLPADDFARVDLYHLAANPVEGQVVYVPAYSHVYHGDGAPYLLAITLSVRNTSLDKEIVLKSVRYFNTKGEEMRSFVDKPVRLPALGTTEIIVERDDATGGSGANFLVEWYAKQPVTEPIIEAVMIDTDSRPGISFVRRGSVISEAVSGVDPGASGDNDADSDIENDSN